MLNLFTAILNGSLKSPICFLLLDLKYCNYVKCFHRQTHRRTGMAEAMEGGCHMGRADIHVPHGQQEADTVVLKWQMKHTGTRSLRFRFIFLQTMNFPACPYSTFNSTSVAVHHRDNPCIGSHCVPRDLFPITIYLRAAKLCIRLWQRYVSSLAQYL